ncbi:hypothetical protein SDC9_46703 [bioreactor metagenome]|uniref:Uncharacterized protein n=1 Tax=bioreactor metagenome TaxID=1076179 RepID=A0A644WAD8_9ZZZZ
MEYLSIREGTARAKAQIVTELMQKHKLDVLLAVAGLSRATYYYHLKRSATPDK